MAIKTLKNGNIVEVLGVSNTKVSLFTENSGFNNERSTFNLSGRMKLRSGKKIGTMKVTAVSDKHFRNNPGLEPTHVNRSFGNKSNIRTRLVSVEKDSNGNTTSCLYDLIYISKESVPRSRALNYKIINDTKDIITRTTGVYGVSFGREILTSSKQSRKIVVRGVPDSTFKLAIIKYTDYKDTALNIVNSTEDSILSTTNANSTATLGNGETVTIVSQTIPASGFYSFNQSFNKVTSETRYSINLLSSDAHASFIENTPWDTLEGQWAGWYGKILTQVVNPKLTLKTETSSWSTVTVDSNGNGSYVTFNSSNPVTTSYTGVYNRRSESILSKTVLKKLDVVHVFKSASEEFSARAGDDGAGGTYGDPKFSTVTGEESDWSNTVWKDDPDNDIVGNGGTELLINKISTAVSTTSSTNDTLTLKYTIQVVKWGKKDVTVTLNVDNIKTLS
tara:strand:- start:682 stop:2025 length:1344 start_codon:yes stop_codon:yes gene_type:complete